MGFWRRHSAEVLANDTLLNEGTNASRTTASNELGEYVFASVLPAYTVRKSSSDEALET
jgi:hypothetical protein